MGELEEYRVEPEDSTVVVEARSSVGPIAWELQDVHGRFAFARTSDGGLDLSTPPTGRMELDVHALRSGNPVYDGELLRRVEADRFPTSVVDLGSVRRLDGVLEATGELTFHGVTAAVVGELEVELRDDGDVVVTGETTLDIRDFDIPAPTMLMLKIYPDVRVVLVVRGTPD